MKDFIQLNKRLNNCRKNHLNSSMWEHKTLVILLNFNKLKEYNELMLEVHIVWLEMQKLFNFVYKNKESLLSTTNNIKKQIFFEGGAIYLQYDNCIGRV